MSNARRRLATTLIPVALLVTACGGVDEEESVDDASSSIGDTPSSLGAEPEADDEKPGEIVKTGFGQRDAYVWVTSLVRNLTDTAGATVTVQYNVLDAAGKILVSDSQVESFSRGGQLLVVGTQLDVPASSMAASVDATLVIEPDGIGTEFPEIETGPVTVGEDEFGGVSASFELTNPTNEPAQSVRVGIICLDATGKIIGGTSEFPDLPPNGAARVDTSALIVSGSPETCEAYAGGPL